jgi:hypothetical protein
MQELSCFKRQLISPNDVLLVINSLVFVLFCKGQSPNSLLLIYEGLLCRYMQVEAKTMECLVHSAWCNFLRQIANDLGKRKPMVLAHKMP